MPETFLHGVEVVQIDTGTRPIRTLRSAVIGIVGTAPAADADAFPLDTPVLIAGNRTEAAKLGATGTLPMSIDGIFDQGGAVVVVVRVDEGADDAETLSNVIGGVDVDSGQYEGLQALLAAENVVHVQPRLIGAPGFSHNLACATELIAIAERLKAITYVDGPNTNDADAIAYRGNFGSDRCMVVDPWVKVWDTVNDVEVIQPASARCLGVVAASDAERGFWWSPSNRVINGITGTARAVSYEPDDRNSRANLLNEDEVTTIIRRDGYRLFGNRSTTADPKWAFIKRRRIADLIGDSIMEAHFWAVDRNITRTFLEDVVDGVKAYGRHLVAVGALVEFDCWASAELNTPEQLEQGKVYIDFDWVETPTAEHITFRSIINNGYLTEVLPAAA